MLLALCSNGTAAGNIYAQYQYISNTVSLLPLYQRLKSCILLLIGTPPQSFRMSLATWGHTVACYLTQVNAPRPSQAGRYCIYLSRRDGRLSWPRWLVIYGDGLPVRRQSPIEVVSSLVSINYVDQSQCADHCTRPPMTYSTVTSDTDTQMDGGKYLLWIEYSWVILGMVYYNCTESGYVLPWSNCHRPQKNIFSEGSLFVHLSISSILIYLQRNSVTVC